MALEMRNECERCRAPAARDGAACICVYECTFCPVCADAMRHVCRQGEPGRGHGPLPRRPCPNPESVRASGRAVA